MWYYCHTCQRRFDIGVHGDLNIIAGEVPEAPTCPTCGDGFVEEISEASSAEDAQSSSASDTPAATTSTVTGPFVLSTAPTAVIRITLPISPSESSASSVSIPSPPVFRSLPGFVQSILGIFTPTGRGNGSNRRRAMRENEGAAEESRSRPRLFPETRQQVFPPTLAATFSTSITEEDLSSPDGLQRLLISLFSQLYDLMSVPQETSSSQPSTQNVPTTTPEAAEASQTEGSRDEATASATPRTPGDMVRMLLQQVLSGQSPIQWVRIPAIPDLLGDYVFGDRAFDDMISSLMEQAAGQRAPPPASQIAIDALLREPYHLGMLPS